MFLKAGVVSLALLLSSRVLGLLRESAMAAAFGNSAHGDLAVLMLSLPDWITGVLAAGALGYVLLPHWAQQGAKGSAASQRRVAGLLLASGVALAALMLALQAPLTRALVPGLPEALASEAATAVLFSALALPAALLASLWVTRLQHEQDFTGMYAANLVVNAVVIAGLLSLVWPLAQQLSPTLWLGLCLLLAMGLRLTWLRWRLSPPKVEAAATVAAAQLPAMSLWAWAALASGLPMVLPFAARSMASAGGPGALATFNYGWKLVELPLVLAIQLVASLSFPAIARAFAADGEAAYGRPAQDAVRSAWALAWTLACMATAGLVVAAPALASLLFGWGRMNAAGLDSVAAWGRIGAWSLLPQAVLAVALSVLAAQGRMKVAVAAYAVAVVLQLGAGQLAGASGAAHMALLDAVLLGAALAVTAALGPRVQRAIPWRTVASTGATLLLIWSLSATLSLPQAPPLSLGLGVLAALLVGLAGWLAGDELRVALRR